MVVKLHKVTLGRMKNDEVQGFCHNFDHLLHQGFDAQHSNKLAPFESALNTFDVIQGKDVAIYGARISAANTTTDQAWRAIKKLLQVQATHFDTSIAQPGQKLLAIVERNGDPTSKPYDQACAIFTRLLDDLEPETIAMQTVHVDDWVAELRRRVNAFNVLRHEKVQSKAELDTGASKSARNTLITEMNTLCDYINAANIIEEGRYDSLIGQLNELIKAKKTTLKAAQTRANGDEDVESSGDSSSDEK